jgi:TATA-binding protein-associated factor Taf7
LIRHYFGRGRGGIDMGVGGKIILWLILVVGAVMLGVGIALWANRKQSGVRRQRKTAVATDGETVYSALGEGEEGDNLDIDPIHEAEIYIAYGNKEMALKVLNKAADAEPDREDIRAKIAELQAH